jgi:WD40 repeat protein
VPGQRRALIVASDSYEHSALRDLRGPGADAEALGRVLADPLIGAFEVEIVHNEPAHVIQARIEDLLSAARRDDVVLVHFSCHGLKDESGELFFAAANTVPNRLGSTAIPADFVHRYMQRSRGGGIVLLLDCCFGGAFPRGAGIRAAGDANVLDSFRPQREETGRGRVVIAASNSMEFALDGDQLVSDEEPRPSVFTAAVVEGLATGDADQDEDGWVSVREFYDYVFDKVRERNPHQTPTTQGELTGKLYLARSQRRRASPDAIPAELRRAMTGDMFARLGAVNLLRSRLASDDLPTATAAYTALKELEDDDSRRVTDAATEALASAVIQPVQADVHFGRVESGSSPPTRTIPVLGIPLARDYAPHASHDWINAEKTDDGLIISADTSSTGTLRGNVTLQGIAGQAVVDVDIELFTPLPPPRQELPSPAPPADRRLFRPRSTLAATGALILVAGAVVFAVATTGNSAAGETGILQTTLPSQRYSPTSVAFNPGGNRLAVGTEDASGDHGAIYVWNLAASPKVTTPDDLQNGPVYRVDFSPDGKILAASYVGVTDLWNTDTYKPDTPLVDPTSNPDGTSSEAIAFTSTSQVLADGDTNITYIWNVADGKRITSHTYPIGNFGVIFSIALTPDGKTVAVGNFDGIVYLWDIASKNATQVFKSSPDYPVSSLIFTPTGATLIIGDYDGSVYQRNMTNNQVSELLTVPGKGRLTAMALSPDGTTLATSDNHGHTYLWDLATRRITATLTDPKSKGVAAIAYSQNGELLAVGDSNGSVYLWKITG